MVICDTKLPVSDEKRNTSVGCIALRRKCTYLLDGREPARGSLASSMDPGDIADAGNYAISAGNMSIALPLSRDLSFPWRWYISTRVVLVNDRTALKNKLVISEGTRTFQRYAHRCKCSRYVEPE